MSTAAINCAQIQEMICPLVTLVWTTSQEMTDYFSTVYSPATSSEIDQQISRQTGRLQKPDKWTQAKVQLVTFVSPNNKETRTWCENRGKELSLLTFFFSEDIDEQTHMF